MSNEIPYKGARFYKCALQVNPASYAKYRGETDLDEETYNLQILEQCQENNIKVVGLADHGGVESSESLRTFLRENGITVFPGFEIASSENIHMVCLYPENKTTEMLNHYLGQLMGENASELQTNRTHPSSLSCEKIAKQVLNDQKGVWYAAHMTGNKGLLRLSGLGDNYVHLWKKDDLVIAGQIPGRIEDLNVEQADLNKYREIIKDKNPDYKREKPIAIINAKDIDCPEALSEPSASCLIKMTEPNFSAFCDAFHDPESRIRLNHGIPQTPYSVIESIQWEGGFFNNGSVGLSKHLNAFIGGRGTGKSTLIESIRYVLDLPYRGEDSKALKSIVDNNLRHSRIILQVTSKAQNGQSYTISKRPGEQPTVKNSQGEISYLNPHDILPDIELLGQNEILEIEKNENAKRELIKSFLPDSHKYDKQIGEIKRRLRGNREKLVKANDEYDELSAVVQKEPRLKEQIKRFIELGIEKKIKNARLLEQEKQVQKRVNEQFHLIQKWLDDYGDIFDLTFLEDENIDELPNKKLLQKVRQTFKRLQETLGQLVEKAVEQKGHALEEYKAIKQNWDEASEKIQDDLNQAISQLPEQAGKSGRELGQEYTDIVTQLTNVERQKKEYGRQEKLIKTIKQERTQLLEDYRNACFNRYLNINAAAKELNKGNLKGKVRIKVLSRGDKDPLKRFLQNIEGVGERKTDWLDNAEDLDLVREWSPWIEENHADAFMKKYRSLGLTNSVADKLTSISLKRRLELEEIELEDIVEIELNIAHESGEERFVPLEKLSTGQKCTAILNLLLLSRDDPLIIDQPEDNLDNAFIADRIVKDLRQFKINRQFLFATHNANIPVFGDAELIVVLNSDSDGGKIEHQGSIDKPEVRTQAAEILEGGQAAFEMRKNKYGF